MEAMDKMFPRGYVVVYACPDGQVRLSLYNPHGYPSIQRAHDLLAENKGDVFEQGA